jgi:hypothetical protein
MKVYLTFEVVLPDAFDDYRAKALLLRRKHRRPIAFDPAHGEGIVLGRVPPDLDLARFCRERALFAGVSCKFMEDETNLLGSSRA